MSMFRRTYREVDGQRVEGTWRPVFLRNAGCCRLLEVIRSEPAARAAGLHLAGNDLYG